MSLRARSISIRCSARSFGSARSSASSAGVVLGRRAARARAGERPDRHLVAFGACLVAHQDLGRRADDLEVAHVVEVHVRRRVERAQRAVEAERRLGVALRSAAGRPAPASGRRRRCTPWRCATAARKSSLRSRAAPARRRPRSTGGAVTLRAQPVGELGERRRRAVANASGTRRVGVDDEVEPPREVVDDRELPRTGRAARRACRSGQQRPSAPPAQQARLDVAHRVVAEVAGEAAAEARQPGPQRDLEALLVGGDEVERVAVVGLDDRAVADDLGAQAGRRAAACAPAGR